MKKSEIALVSSIGVTALFFVALGGLKIKDMVDRKEEIKNSITQYSKDGNLSIEESKKYIYKEHDENNDGYISFEEADKITQKANAMVSFDFTESSRNIMQALMEIDKEQEENRRK